MSATIRRPRGRKDFRIAILCALTLEADAVCALLDEKYDEITYSFKKAAGDCNTYTTGRIGEHYVVVAHLSGMGKVAASQASATLPMSFTNVNLGLVVGICGAAPKTESAEILLGDVIICTGLIQYDLGKQYPDEFLEKDTLNDSLGRQATEIRTFVKMMSELDGKRKLRIGAKEYSIALASMDLFQDEEADSTYLGPEADHLFEPSYRHKHQDGSCPECARCLNDSDPTCERARRQDCEGTECDLAHLVPRKRQIKDTKQGEPAVHFGLMASGDRVLKSAAHRDYVVKKQGVIAFEMEGAGVWDNLPTVVIKAACDYADSHKQKQWQRYAAATAAGCMKTFIQQWRASDSDDAAAAQSTSADTQARNRSREGSSSFRYGNQHAEGNGKISNFGNITTGTFNM